jgi:hypothetical protein
MLGAHPAQAGVAFDAFVLIDGRAILNRVNVDRAHRADGDAVPARDALPGINRHNALHAQAPLVALRYCAAAIKLQLKK